MKIKAVVFDYGGVLNLDQDAETFRVMADITGAGLEEFRSAYWKNREAYDRGASGFHFWTGIFDTLGCKLPDEQTAMLIKLDSLSWSHLNPYMMRWAHAVSLSGRQTALCSNMPSELAVDLFENRLCRDLPKPLVFDPVVTSCSLKKIKPEPGIYLDLINKLSLSPDEILFLDDRVENAAGARSLGITAPVFVSHKKLMEELPGIDPDIPVIKTLYC